MEEASSDSNWDSLDKDMLALLFSYEDEGWLPALANGTRLPMWGSLTGKQSGSKMKHEFGYYGLPDTYRIIIVTKSGEVRVSRPYTRKVLQSSITYNYQTGKAKVPPIFLAYLIQFLITCCATLLIEFGILLLFRYSIKKNWPVFLLVNLATQIFMTFTLGVTLIFHSTLMAFLVFFPVELAIAVAESIAYCFLLRGKTKKRNIVYALIANLTSFLIGFFVINGMAPLIVGML